MKRLFLFSLLIGYWSVVRASDTVFIKEAQVPILIERQDNLLFYLRFDARDSRMLDGVTVDLSRCKKSRRYSICEALLWWNRSPSRGR